MKVKNFLADVSGASRVTAARMMAFDAASPALTDVDPIGNVSREWHPGPIELVVTGIKPACKTAKTIRFERTDGKKLPFFYAGQYIVLDFKIGESLISRPKGDGFICDYVNDELKVGDILTGTMGLGQFYYEPLRDAKHVVALAGGVGITPFASMAKEVVNGTLDIDLTILYGSASSDDIVMKEELEALDGACDKLHIVHVLSGDEPGWTGEKGFLTAELIKKYSAEDTTYFICGPQVMYTFLRGEVAKLDVPKRRVRFEVFGQVKDIAVYEGYPRDLRDETFELTVVRGISEVKIPAKACESIVVALERAGIRIETGCRSGECGFCRTKVLSGDYFVCPEGDGRREADKDFNYVHACAAYPLSDMKIKIPIL